MKVLFLTFAYPPKKFPRSVQISHLVNYLKDKIKITIITYPLEDTGDKSLLAFTTLDNVIYAPESFLTKFVKRMKGHRIKTALLPDFFYFWHFDLYKKASSEIDKQKTEVIVTFGQPMSSHLAGWKLKRKYPHIKWIAHFSDPWVDNSFNDYNFWTKKINNIFQDNVFNQADRLVFTSQETIELVMRNYSPEIRSKTTCLPHSFDQKLFPTDIQKNDVFTIRYLGNFYGERNPKFLFKALKTLNNIEDLKVELIGASTTSIDEDIKIAGLENTVHAVKSVDYLTSLKMMKESDLLLILDAPAVISPFLPSKLIDYVGANRPIFGITSKGTSQELIERMGFLTADPNNEKEIQTNLKELINQVRSGKKSRIPEDLRDQFSIEMIGSEMLKILKN